MAGSLSIALAAARSASDRAGGLPPVRPLSRAALRPARVLSRITDRSNSASAPKIWKITASRKLPSMILPIFAAD
jgi:hypothetical protein